VSASLCKLDAMDRATQSRGKDISLTIDVLGRRYDGLAITRPRLCKNVFAQPDDLFIIRERCLEAVDRCDILLDRALKLRGKCLLFSRDYLSLKLSDLSVT
jgi:hypothetical protein